MSRSKPEFPRRTMGAKDLSSYKIYDPVKSMRLDKLYENYLGDFSDNRNDDFSDAIKYALMASGKLDTEIISDLSKIAMQPVIDNDCKDKLRAEFYREIQRRAAKDIQRYCIDYFGGKFILHGNNFYIPTLRLAIGLNLESAIILFSGIMEKVKGMRGDVTVGEGNIEYLRSFDTGRDFVNFSVTSGEKVLDILIVKSMILQRYSHKKILSGKEGYVGWQRYDMNLVMPYWDDDPYCKFADFTFEKFIEDKNGRL